MRLIAVMILAAVGGQTASNISGPAYTLLNKRISLNQSQFFVFEDDDSPFNHGFPSGLFGSSAAAMRKLNVSPSCVYSANTANGCSTDPTAIDRTRGTVFQFTFAPLVSGEYVGLNFEAPENWGVNHNGIGYDLTGANLLVFDAVSPTGGMQVQFSVNGSATAYMSIPQQWSTITINLNSLGLTSLTGVHLLFGIATNNINAPNGGTVLLDNIHFLPVPTSQTIALGLPLANQVFGIEHVQNALSGNVTIPPDQINSNLATLYESSLAIIALIDRGQPQDLTNAKLIADTLVYALGHDNQGDPLPVAPGYATGLHNGTFAGDIALFNSQSTQGGRQGQVRLAGFTASVLCSQTGFCLVLDGATGGNNAFAILALLAAYKQFQSASYLNAALTIGNWINGSLLDSSGTGYGGYFVGYPDEGLPKILQTGKSTENNADIFAAFTALASAENGSGNTSAAGLWTTRANVAGDFVMQMYDSGTGHFFAGTVPATQVAAAGIYPTGAHKGNDVINTFDFLDTETFTTLAMAPAPHYGGQIDWRLPVQWALDHFQSSVTAANVTFQGFDLIQASEHLATDGPAGVAWEFTGQVVAAMKVVDGLYGTSQFAGPTGTYLNQIQQAQAAAPFTDSLGIVASTLQNGDTVAPYQQCFVTPYQCIAERVGLAATIWGIAAEQGLDPFLSTALPTKVLQTITFGALSNQVLGTAPFTLSATASSGLGVTFISNTLSVCTVSGVSVTLIAVGTCSITASQTGNSNYAAATPVTQSFTINPASQTNIITWTLQNVTFAKGETVSGWFQVNTSGPKITAWNLTFGGLPSYDPASLVGTASTANYGPGGSAVGFDDPYYGGVTISAYPEGNGTGNPFVFIYLNGPSIPLYAVGNYVDPLIANISESSITYGLIGSPFTSALTTGTLVQAAGTGGATLAVTPAALNFQASQGAPAQSQSLQIGGTAGTAWQATAATSSGGSWLSVSPIAGQIPASLTALVNSGSLGVGTYQGSITIQAPTATPSSSTIKVTLTVAATSAPSVSFTLYPIPTPDSSPFSIVSGPDGALWFTEANGNKIGRITTAGVITEYALPPVFAYPEGITAGPDGALWFAEYGDSKIGRITTSGEITEYPIPTSVGAQPCCITAGSDGALWFTGLSNNIGRITTSGVFTSYPVHPSTGALGDITNGPDRALWFADFTTGSMGRMTTSGSITEYPGAAGGSITNGPDGALWFTLAHSGIGRITTAGVITLYGVPGGDSDITTGPDGAMWVTQFNGSGGVLGRITITPSGAISYYTISEPNYPPVNEFGSSITTGPDGALWFTDYAPGLIGRAALSVRTNSVVVNPGGAVSNASYVAKVAPGSLFSIFGNNMSSGVVNGFPVPLPISSNGTEVTVNGIPAPLLYVSPTLINAQVPVDVTPGTATVSVSYNGTSGSTTVSVLTASPGFFIYGPVNEVNFALGQHSSGALVTPSAPAHPGEVIGFYGTGIGPVSPSLASGHAAGDGPNNLSTSTSTYSATINGVNAPVDFLGLTPGGVGLMQINIQVPAGTPSGNLPLIVSINGVRSQSNINIPVGP